MFPRRRPSWPLLALPLATLLVMSSWLFPLDRLPVARGDLGQMAWNLWITTESLERWESPYLTQMVYYPVGANLATHTLAAGFFPVALLVKGLSGGAALYPFYAYKACLLLSFLLLPALSFLFLREVGFAPLHAFPPALAFGFADYFVHHAVHLNLIAGFLIPLVAWLVVRTYRHPSRRRALLLAFVLGLTVYFSEYFVYLCLGLAILAGLWCLHPQDRQELGGRLRRLGWGTGSLAALLFVATFGYYAVLWIQADPLPVSGEEVREGSADLAGFLLPHWPETPLYALLLPSRQKETLRGDADPGMGGYVTFLGYPFLALALLGVWAGERRTRHSAAVALFFLALSLGPTVILFGVESGIVAPFRTLQTVPPFDQMRVPARFVVMVLFLLTVPAAQGLRALLERCRKSAVPPLVAWAPLTLWILLESYTPWTLFGRLDLPLETLRSVTGPVLVLPVDAAHGLHAALQTVHGQPISSGYVARRTREQEALTFELLSALEEEPTRLEAAIAELGYRSALIAQPIPWPHFDRLSRSTLTVVSLPHPPYETGSVTLFRDGDATGPSPPDLPRDEDVLRMGRALGLSRSERGVALLGGGWSTPEEWGVWSDGPAAELVFHLESLEDLVLQLEGHTHGRQRIRLYLNGHRLERLDVAQGSSLHLELTLPREHLRRANRLRFELPDAHPPGGEDRRQLALALTTFTLHAPGDE